MVTDTTERGLEALITNSQTANGWLPGDPHDYLPAHCVDLSHLSAFLSATQSETAATLDHVNGGEMLGHLGGVKLYHPVGKASEKVRANWPA